MSTNPLGVNRHHIINVGGPQVPTKQQPLNGSLQGRIVTYLKDILLNLPKDFVMNFDSFIPKGGAFLGVMMAIKALADFSFFYLSCSIAIVVGSSWVAKNFHLFDTLTVSNENLQKAHKNLEETHENLAQAKVLVEKQRDQFAHQNDQLGSQVNTLKSQNKEIAIHVSEMKKERNAFKQELQIATKKLEETPEKIKKEVDELKKLENEQKLQIARLSGIKESMENQVGELRTEVNGLKAAKQEYQKLNTDNLKLHKENLKLHQSLQKTTSQLQLINNAAQSYIPRHNSNQAHSLIPTSPKPHNIKTKV